MKTTLLTLAFATLSTGAFASTVEVFERDKGISNGASVIAATTGDTQQLKAETALHPSEQAIAYGAYVEATVFNSTYPGSVVAYR